MIHSIRSFANSFYSKVIQSQNQTIVYRKHRKFIFVQSISIQHQTFTYSTLQGIDTIKSIYCYCTFQMHQAVATPNSKLTLAAPDRDQSTISFLYIDGITITIIEVKHYYSFTIFKFKLFMTIYGYVSPHPYGRSELTSTLHHQLSFIYLFIYEYHHDLGSTNSFKQLINIYIIHYIHTNPLQINQIKQKY